MCVRARGSGRASCTHALPPAERTLLFRCSIHCRDGNAINQNNRALSHVFMNEMRARLHQIPIAVPASLLQRVCGGVLSSVKICYIQ
jgi:hypothetical protein